MNRFKTTLTALGATAVFGLAGTAHAGATLDAIQKKALSNAASATACPVLACPTARAR